MGLEYELFLKMRINNFLIFSGKLYGDLEIENFSSIIFCKWTTFNAT